VTEIEELNFAIKSTKLELFNLEMRRKYSKGFDGDYQDEERVIEFIMPDGVLAYSRPIALIRAKEALKITSGKWAIDDDFSSEDSFFTDHKRNFCRCKLKKA